MEIYITIAVSAIFTLIGIGATWYLSDYYYSKSMSNQNAEAQKEIDALIAKIDVMTNNESQKKIESHEILLQKILSECIEEYRKMGTPVRVLDSYDNITTEEKANLYDKTMLRVKGRLGKSNKYKK